MTDWDSAWNGTWAGCMILQNIWNWIRISEKIIIIWWHSQWVMHIVRTIFWFCRMMKLYIWSVQCWIRCRDLDLINMRTWKQDMHLWWDTPERNCCSWDRILHSFASGQRNVNWTGICWRSRSIRQFSHGCVIYSTCIKRNRHFMNWISHGKDSSGSMQMMHTEAFTVLSAILKMESITFCSWSTSHRWQEKITV